MKLSLTKKFKGYYSKRVGGIQVVVAKNNDSNGWSGSIEIYTHTAKDFEGTKVEMFDVLTSYNGLTKNEVYSALKNYLMNPEKY